MHADGMIFLLRNTPDTPSNKGVSGFLHAEIIGIDEMD
jgi:hypothetical protein